MSKYNIQFTGGGAHADCGGRCLSGSAPGGSRVGAGPSPIAVSRRVRPPIDPFEYRWRSGRGGGGARLGTSSAWKNLDTSQNLVLGNQTLQMSTPPSSKPPSTMWSCATKIQDGNHFSSLKTQDALGSKTRKRACVWEIDAWVDWDWDWAQKTLRGENVATNLNNGLPTKSPPTPRASGQATAVSRLR